MSTAEARSPTEDSDDRANWRDAVPRLLAVFLVTRLLLAAVALSLEFSIPLGHRGLTWDDRPLLESLTGSDAVYYLGIADEGYHLDPVKEDHRDWVFFPLYPIVVRAASVLTLGDIGLAGVLTANVAFFAAMLLLYRLSVRHLSHGTAVRSVVFLTIAPGAVAFAMAYSESLFLLLAVGACLAAETRRWPVMGLLYCLAALTRLPGVALGLPLLLLMIPSLGRRARPEYLWLATGPLALLGFLAFVAQLTGDPWAYFEAQEAWTIAPLVGSDPQPGTIAGAFTILPVVLIATLLLYVFLFVFARVDRMHPAYVTLAVVAVVSVLLGGRLQSVARYLVVAWPFAWLLASRRAAWFRSSWPVLSAGLFVLHAVLHFTQALAP